MVWWSRLRRWIFGGERLGRIGGKFMVFRKIKQKEGVASDMVRSGSVSSELQQMPKDRGIGLPRKDEGCCLDGPRVGLELGSLRLMKRTRI